MSTEPIAPVSEIRPRFPAVLYARGQETTSAAQIGLAAGPASIRREGTRAGYAVGIIVSAAVHAGGLFLFNGRPDAMAAQAPAVAAEIVELVEMPPLEPETPVEVVESEATDAPPDVAPPALFDVPEVAPVSAFVQQMRPVMPTMTGVPSLTVIPSNRGNFGEGPAIRLFEFAELDRVPRRLKTVAPGYPTEMKRARIQGEVLLILIIDEGGRVTVERVAESTTREFANAAVAAVEQCVFESPLKNGQRVRARYSMRVPFILQ